MKLELIKPMGKMKVGDTFKPQSDEQGQMLIKEEFAKEVEDDPIVEKELVLVSPEPGTYTTQWINKQTEEQAKAPAQAAITAKELIDKVNAASTIDEVNGLVPETETRKTVTDAAAKKINELSKGQ